jgi:transposase
METQSVYFRTEATKILTRFATTAFKAQYADRAGIESTLSQGVRAFGLRRSRYIGLAKTHLQHILIAVGINLKRVMVWFTHPQPTKPYVPPFVALVSSG